jgi:dipeptidyl aminopeptidase/acylaminoacyl peptidase
MTALFVEREAVVESEVAIAAVLCLPDTAGPHPTVLLIGGSGADTRDGDLNVERTTPTGGPSIPGTLRHVAHHLAARAIATLRWDRRGFGQSGGDPAHVHYGTDLVDAQACLAWARRQPEIAPGRIAVAGHSAGALTTCRMCRDDPDVAGAGLLGALSSPIEDMLRWNVGRLRRHWDSFTEEQRDWLRREMPRTLLRSERIEDVVAAAQRGEDVLTLEGHGVTLEVRTARLRQDLATSYADEMRPVACPTLVLHGGDDLNVPVVDALRSYQTLRDAGNDDVELVVLPGLDHYYCPVAPDRSARVWERITGEGLRRPMSQAALDAIGRWATRVLAPS